DDVGQVHSAWNAVWAYHGIYQLAAERKRLCPRGIMFELKPLHTEAIPAALEKANRYRLLNEPGAAESIYLDVLAIDPDNQDALEGIVLAMSDRFGKDYAIGDARVTEYLMRIHGDYERNYYSGI